jgi:hypothetical protein
MNGFQAERGIRNTNKCQGAEKVDIEQGAPVFRRAIRNTFYRGKSGMVDNQTVEFGEPLYSRLYCLRC